MKRFGAALLAGLIPTLLLAGKAVPARAYAPAELQFRDLRLTRILGLTVEDPNAEEVGTVKDLVLNLPAARIEYVIVGSRGLFGMGARAQAVPAPALLTGTIIRGILGTSITKAEWQKAPAFSSELAALANPLGGGSPGQPVRPPQHGANAVYAGPPPKPASAPTPTGRQTGDPRPEPAAQNNWKFTRDLLGKAVLDAQQQKLGKITDLLVDLTGQKTPVVILCARRLLHPDRCFAVPLPLLKVSPGNKLMLDANRRRLEQAPLFTEQAWQSTINHRTYAIYRIAGATES